MQSRTFKLGIILALFTFLNASLALAQKDESIIAKKEFTRQTLKKLTSNLATWSKRGFVPTDANATVKGTRATFALQLLKLRVEPEWRAEFELDDGQFQKLHQESLAKQYRLVCHREYSVKDESRHVAIWHFDKDYKPVLDHGIYGKDPTPKPEPIGSLWKAISQVPESGQPVRGFGQVDQTIKEIILKHQLPGISLAISVKGKIVYARAFGYRDIQTLSVLRPTDVMRTFHCSRPLTSTAIMQLVGKGEISLSTPVIEFLDIKLANDADPNLRKITVDDLLDSIGGFDKSQPFDPIRSPAEVGKAIEAKDRFVTDKQIIEFMMTQPLASAPGDKRGSSNFGYFLLGKVIEKAGQLPYEEYIKRNVLDPLEISTMSIGRTVKEHRPKNEVSYTAEVGHSLRCV